MKKWLVCRLITKLEVDIQLDVIGKTMEGDVMFGQDLTKGKDIQQEEKGA